MLRILTLVLAVLLGAVHFRLWVDHDGVPGVWRLRQSVEAQRAENRRFARRNRELAAEVRDLKEGLVAVESLARRELGMLAPGEILFQIVDR